MRTSIITSIILGVAPALLVSCGDKEPSEVINVQQQQQQKTADMQAARTKLQEKGYEFTEAGFLAMLHGDCQAEILDLYLKAGVPVSPQILFDVVNRISVAPNDTRRAELLKCVEVLIKNGVNVNAADATGTTALHLAAKSWCPEAAKMLLEAGADRKAVNKQGATPDVYAFGADMRAVFGLEKIEITPGATKLPEPPAAEPAQESALPVLPAEEEAAVLPSAEETLLP